ncbi:protein FAR1-RELATED SEQUENCE 5-like [Lactuca sativa]|uniref:protein FAR1-RELATED SEQUENCE 5-like n=1 Tax=Lactuca sativa TaxID=4236 RepID=UPI0022AFD1B2|nr:protein FAR1-RELATED SEQUENCE 5-like [Lactuca sativa]
MNALMQLYVFIPLIVKFRICVSVLYFVFSFRFDQIIWCIMLNSSVIDGDLYSSMSESEEEGVENSFFKGGESSSSVHDAQYCDDIIGEHVYKPYVPVQLIPFKGLIFKSLKLAIKMYSEYAEIGGFDVRLSTQSMFDNKIIKKKHVICNRGGKQKKKSCDTLGTSGVRRKQNSNSRAIVCQEKIIFESVYGTPDYKVFQFDELHNHPLEKRGNLKKARQISYSEKEFIVCASTSKIGPSMAHKLRASLRGGYEFVKPKVVDYKNLRRDINRVIGYKDAQMIVNIMNDRRAHYPNYSFEFNRQDDVLDCMFWADEMENAYYVEFGDVISFDATFRTNKYQMLFVPFTAIDHHKKSVTVGSGLLSNESIESYSWLLKAFLKTHGKEPTLVLTDQDATIKQAVENVFLEKRYHMIYLLTQTLEKGFRSLFGTLISVFEVKWGLLMKEFNLEDTRWFKDMFTIRDSWIPGYFSDIPMCGLMKTTSRSESMNSFFNTYSESGNLLLNFMMNYDTTIQKQRNTQRELDKASKKASYKMQTPREIELQASKVEIKAEEKEINCSLNILSV